MKKIKIEQRIEKAINAFFETENDKVEIALTHSSCSTALMPNAAECQGYIQKVYKWFGVFKQVFLFFSGTFLLFSLTLALFELFAFPNYHFIADFEMITGLFFLVFFGKFDGLGWTG